MDWTRRTSTRASDGTTSTSWCPTVAGVTPGRRIPGNAATASLPSFGRTGREPHHETPPGTRDCPRAPGGEADPPASSVGSPPFSLRNSGEGTPELAPAGPSTAGSDARPGRLHL